MWTPFTIEDSAIFSRTYHGVGAEGTLSPMMNSDDRDAERMRGFEVARRKGFTPAERVTEVEWRQYV